MDLSLGERISLARKKLDLTLAELAERTSFSPGYLSKLQRNEAGPPLSTLKILAKALEVSVSYLAGEEPVEGEPSLAMLFAEHIRSLSPEEKRRLEECGPAGRFGKVVFWLCDRYPAVFPLPLLAARLDLSLQGLLDILAGVSDNLSSFLFDQIADLTGLSCEFFATGCLGEQVAAGGQAVAALALYHPAISQALEHGLEPGQIAEMIAFLKKIKTGEAAAIQEAWEDPMLPSVRGGCTVADSDS